MLSSDILKMSDDLILSSNLRACLNYITNPIRYSQQNYDTTTHLSMKLFKFIFMLALTIGFTVLLSNSLKIGQANLPPIGKFLSPFTGFWQNTESATPDYQKTLEFSELSAPVQVLYDDRLIPHIFAENVEDATFAQGYVTAQHRLWQMEFQTHAAAGRLSEISGEATLKMDKQTRRRGMLWAAEKVLKYWQELPEYHLVERYTDGINAYINSLSPEDYPLEYKLINYAPEAWTPLKIVLLQKQMSRTLASREYDVENTLTREWLGEEEFDFLFPENNPKQSPIIPKSREWNFKPKVVTKDTKTNSELGQLNNSSPHQPNNSTTPQPNNSSLHQLDLFEKPYEGIGSNNWALSGSKTASGYPILCSDPHLRLTVPSIWYEIQITTPEMNVYGVSLPGSPGVIIGFNEDIAWGMTNVGHDVSDWYTIDWKDDSRQEYLYNGEYRKTEFRVEEYDVRRVGKLRDTVLYTHFGPVAHMSDDPSKDLALRWLAHDLSNDMTAFLNLNTAKNYNEYKAAIAEYSCPAQNFAFADRKDVALWVQGKFPLKKDQQGRFVQVGNSDATQWAGFVPREHNPHVLNPPRAYISSANQHSTSDDYPYYYNGGFGDFRGRHINNVLDNSEKSTAKDMMALQQDSYGLHAAELLPDLLKYINSSDLNKEEKEMLAILQKWDFVFRKNEIAPSVFQAWSDEFYEATWDEFAAKKNVKKPEYWRTIDLLQNNPTNKYFDHKETSEKETAKEIANRSFKAACKKIIDWKKTENQDANWSDYRNTTIEHLARIPAFSLKNIETDGHRYSPNAVSERHGPSWRMVVEMGEQIRAHGVYPGGQSGNPGSPYFDNFTDTWAAGEYYDLLFMKKPDADNERIIFSQKFE